MEGLSFGEKIKIWYKVVDTSLKEQKLRNPLFTFPKQIFTEHVYNTYHIYRYKQYIINIKIVRILITITATAMMLLINNNNINNNNYNCSKKKKKKKQKTEKKKRKKKGQKTSNTLTD